MNRETSLYLDATRFVAAVVVFIDHFSRQRLTGGLLWQFRYLADEAVIVFFVLSGFVIAYVTDTRERSPFTYGINRAARIYSVALPAILLTFVLDAIGAQVRPDFYPPGPDAFQNNRLVQFFTAITFTHTWWGFEITPGVMSAYWSLGYEVWYYVIFGLVVFSPPRWRPLAVGTTLVAVGPQILLLFPTWLMGVLVYYIHARGNISKRWGAGLFVASLVLWGVYEMWSWSNDHPLGNFGAALGHPSRPTLVADYVIALLFALNLIGFGAVSREVGPVFLWAAPTIRRAAAATFALYLLHEPIGMFLGTLNPWQSSSFAGRVFVITLTLVAIFALARVTEQKKDAWRRVIRALVVRLGAREESIAN